MLFCEVKTYELSKWFQEACVIPSERYWSTAYTEQYASVGEAIAMLCEKKKFGCAISVQSHSSKHAAVCSFKLQPKEAITWYFSVFPFHVMYIFCLS